MPNFDRFVATFDRPEDEYLKAFWLDAFYVEHGGSGQSNVFFGWVTVFAYWLHNDARSPHITPTARTLWPKPFKPQLCLDGQLYPIID